MNIVFAVNQTDLNNYNFIKYEYVTYVIRIFRIFVKNIKHFKFCNYL